MIVISVQQTTVPRFQIFLRKCFCYLLGMYSFREIREKRKSRFHLIKYAKIIGKIGKVLEICISAICNGFKQNKLRIIAVPFFFQAIVFLVSFDFCAGSVVF